MIILGIFSSVLDREISNSNEYPNQSIFNGYMYIHIKTDPKFLSIPFLS